MNVLTRAAATIKPAARATAWLGRFPPKHVPVLRAQVAGLHRDFQPGAPIRLGVGGDSRRPFSLSAPLEWGRHPQKLSPLLTWCFHLTSVKYFTRDRLIRR
jgi:hypothetical protein